jgi:hypothetical protein
MPDKLSLPEAIRLKELETIVDDGEQTFIKVGQALNEINERRLYRMYKDNFEDYVRSKWFRGSAWAFRMIKAAVVVKSLPTKLSPMVNNERTARALACVPEESRQAVVKHINDSNKKVNSSTIKEAAMEVVAKPVSTAIDEDANGCPIPAHALQYWKEKQDVQDMLTAISEVRSHIRKRVEAGDKLWIDKSATQRLQVDLDSVYTIIKNFMPYAVCTVCQGHVANGSCDSCHGTGLVSEFHYKHFSDKRSIAIRQGERANVRA